MTKRTVNVLTFSILAAFSMAVWAEPAVTVKLSQVTGNVMVNDGARFVKAASGQQIKPGSKVIASKDSTVELIYQNGCVKQVKANSMLTVGTQAECVAKISDERIYVAAAGTPNGLAKKSILTNPLAVTAIVATAIAVPVALTNSDSSNNNDPVSP